MEYLQYLGVLAMAFLTFASFKPYYNWNAFNTVFEILKNASFEVLNLIITGIPSIPYLLSFKVSCGTVLNLIITGIPSILNCNIWNEGCNNCFKPYYNWNTFNTKHTTIQIVYGMMSFKPYYNWNTFNTA